MSKDILTFNHPSALQTSTDYANAATSDNTRKAYQKDIQHYINSGAVLPATVDAIMTYLQTYANSLNARTLKRHIVALKHWHTYQGIDDPTVHPLVRKTLSGIQRIHGKPAEKAKVLTIDQLQILCDLLTNSSKLSDCRNNALLQIGFFGAFRRSELVAIRWEHINHVTEGLTIMIPRSKTDQLGDGQLCAIPYGNDNICPLRALRLWQVQSGLTHGPVFRAIEKGGCIKDKALSAASVNEIIKKLAIRAEFLNPQAYSGHSLRRGFATSASQKGASMGAIMRQGRWRHEGTVQGYIEEGSKFNMNAVNTILGGA